MTKITLSVYALTLIVSCDGGRSEGSTERDSAGIQIVDNVPTAQGSLLVADSPNIVIGDEGSIPLFGVAGVIQQRSGQIVLGNQATRQLLMFDSSATKILRSVGGQGMGPGEFSALTSVTLMPGDSILAFDKFARRMTVFSPSLRYARELRPEAPLVGVADLVGVFGDGTIVLSFSESLPASTSAGVQVITATFSHHTATGTLIKVLGKYPVDELSITPTRIVLVKPFANRTTAAVGYSELYVATTNGAEVLSIKTDGRVSRIARLRAAKQPVTNNDIEAFRAGLKQRDPDIPEAVLASLVFPETFPVHGGIAVDPCGGFWLQQYSRPNASEQVWWQFDESGNWRATVNVPGPFLVKQVTENGIWGVHRDEDGVETIRRYSFRNTRSCGEFTRD